MTRALKVHKRALSPVRAADRFVSRIRTTVIERATPRASQNVDRSNVDALWKGVLGRLSTGSSSLSARLVQSQRLARTASWRVAKPRLVIVPGSAHSQAKRSMDVRTAPLARLQLAQAIASLRQESPPSPLPQSARNQKCPESNKIAAIQSGTSGE